MSITIFTATGCARCMITKKYMQGNNINYDEFDIKSEGKDAFNKFYRQNRKNIFRDEDGVEFPVFTDGKVIRQGVSVIIGYLVAQDRLSDFISRCRLHGEWLDGIHVSSGSPKDAKDLYAVMSHLKEYGLKIEITTDGRNSVILESILEKNLADRVLMDVKGPGTIWEAELDAVDVSNDINKSISVVARFAEYQFYTVIKPVKRTDGDKSSFSFITPEEIGQAAEVIEQATGSKKHPYFLKPWNVAEESNEQLRSIKPLPDSAMFKYRTMARRYMVMTEFEK